MNRIRTFAGAAAAVLVSAILTACGGESAQDEGGRGDVLRIEGAGATFPEPLYRAWIARYEEENADVAFSYQGVGSGQGIKRFIAAEVDFGASDAAMKDEEIAQVEGGVKMIPVTAGMVVLAYNLPGVEGELRLPRDVYADIFHARVDRWDDARIKAANPGLDLPAKLIQPVVRRDGSGTTFAFTNHLSAISPSWREEGPGTGKLIDWPGAAMTGIGNEGVAQKVKISHGSIGYMEYGFARRLGLPVATLQNAAGNFVRPDAASGRAALAAAAAGLPEDLRLFIADATGPDSYPIVSLSWILLRDRYNDPAKASALREAMSWGLNQGQPIAEEMGYIPLPAAIVSAATEAAASIQ